jgi:addiction module RelE/StbE family toxin
VAYLSWHSEALEDLDQIAEFIARQTPEFAPYFVQRILSAADGLRDHPRRGRVVPEIGDETYRELIFQNYRIVYRVMDERIVVIGLIHSAMDITRQAARREWDLT